MTENILCNDLFGKKIEIPREKVQFRPSVYGVIVHEGKILLCNTKSTGKDFFPGGGLDVGEKIEDALRREVYEETGIAIEIKRLLGISENNAYYNPTDEAWAVIAIFFLCTPKSFEFSLNDPYELEAEKPHWVDIKELQKEQFQVFGEFIMEKIKDIEV